jgi:hypothetical protein
MVMTLGGWNLNYSSASLSNSPNIGWLNYTGTMYRSDYDASLPPMYTATCPLGVVTAGSPPPSSSIRCLPALHPSLRRQVSDAPTRRRRH